MIELTGDGLARLIDADAHDRGAQLLVWANNIGWRVWFSSVDERRIVTVETADGAITTTMSDGRMELREQAAFAIEHVGLKGGWLR